MVVRDLYEADGALLYQALTRGDSYEVRELLVRVRSSTGAILELAAGAGRLTVPLLSLGRPVTALDRSSDMLALLRARLEELPVRARELCSVVRADLADFALSTRFGAIVLGTTTISLLDAQGRAGFYRSAREQLAAGGRLLVSVVDFGRVGSAAPERRIQCPHPHTGRPYLLSEKLDAERGVRVVTISPGNPRPDDDVFTSTIHVVPVETVTAEMGDTGWSVRDVAVLTPSEDRYRGVLIEAELAG